MNVDTQMLLGIHGRVNAMMDNSRLCTGRELRALEDQVREYRTHVETIERRAAQAKELEQPDSEPVRWMGDIGTFCSDLVFAAKRLKRPIHGEFNGVALVGLPDSDASALSRAYWEHNKP